MTRGEVSLTAWLLLGVPWVAAAEDVRKLLKKPVTPGAVAMLVEHAKEPGVRERWSEALRHTDPQVRAAAARAINISGTEELVPALLSALEAEGESEAAVEQIRALAVLGQESGDQSLMAVARRLGSATQATLAEQLVRVRGAASIDRLHAAGLVHPDWRRLVRIAASIEPAALTRAAVVAVRMGDPAVWDGVLGAARESGATPDPGVLVAALSSPSEPVRALTCWHLAWAWMEARELAPLRALEALGSLPPAARTGVDASFACTLVGRAQGETPLTDAAWVDRLGVDTNPALPADLLSFTRLLRLLTPDEQRALSRRLFHDGDELARRLSESEGVDRARRNDSAPGHPRDLDTGVIQTRTLGPLPAGLLRDIFTVARCNASAGMLAAAEIRYDPAGRPRAIGFAHQGLQGSCDRAARAALLLALDVPAAPPAGTLQLVLLPLDQDVLDCVQKASWPATSPRVGGLTPGGKGVIREPKKVQDVRPVYPGRAQQNRVQGVVILEAVIGLEGCVQSIRTLRSPDPDLTVEAIRAVSGWRYTQTLLNDVPVPVIMTVTVNFRLR